MAERVKCPQCGASNKASDINCMLCGTALTTEPPKPPAPVPPPTPAAAAEPGAAQPTEAGASARGVDAEKRHAHILQRMREGADNQTIVDELVKSGVDRQVAEQAVQATDAQVAEAAAQEEYGLSSILGGLVGGLLAAVVVGVIWGFIVVKTEREIGYVAWGIGLLCGCAVVLLAGRKKGLPFQIIAALSSVLGIAIGKYATFFMLLKQELAKAAEQGETVPDPSVLDPVAILTFFHALPEMVSGFDILWVIVAVLLAWQIPKGLGVKRPSHIAPPARIG